MEEPKESFQGSAPLHGFRRGQFIGGRVDARIGIVYNGSRTSVALGNAADGRKT